MHGRGAWDMPWGLGPRDVCVQPVTHLFFPTVQAVPVPPGATDAMGEGGVPDGGEFCGFC